MNDTKQSIKRILIAGNGPSLTKIDYRRIPDNIDIFRMNNFFFEDKYYLGKKVDFYFTDFGFLNNQYFNLRYLNENNEYNIGTILSNQKAEQKYPTVKDIFDTISKNKKFHEFIWFYDKYYKMWVSGGIASIFYAVEKGYDEIYLVGFDFYSTENYPWKHVNCPIFQKYIPRDTDDNVKNVINRYHPTDLQTKALKLIKKASSCKLYSICNDTKLNDYIELAPIINKNKKFNIQTKNSNATLDWLELPTILPDVFAKETLSNSDTENKSETKIPPTEKSNFRSSPLTLSFILNAQRIRFLSHVTFGKTKQHYKRKWKRIKAQY